MLAAIRGRSLGACLAGRRDNILYLRLLAAFAVVFNHSGLGGTSAVPYDYLHRLLPATYAHVAGLIFFFLISGFLITSSFDRRPHLVRFLRARFLRIWPALALCGVILAFIVGPIVTTLPLRNYFSLATPDNAFAYALGSLSIFGTKISLAGVFVENKGLPYANGPLWTIPVEATMYVCVAAAGVLRLLRFPWITSALIATLFGVLILWPMMTGPFQTTNTALSLQGFFGAGAIAYLLRDYIPISTPLMIVILGAAILARDSVHAIPFVWLALAYFAFWFSYVPKLPSMPGDTDISYGVYIWSWPIQQTLALYAGIHAPLVLFGTTTLIVVPIALASWVFVEKPSLALKDFSLRRRVPLQLAASDVVR